MRTTGLPLRVVNKFWLTNCYFPTGNSLVNKRALQSGISPVDEAQSKRLRGNDYVADEAQNVTSDLGWRHRDD